MHLILEFTPLWAKTNNDYACNSVQFVSNLVKFNDVRMTEQFEVLDFPPDFANHIQTLDFLSVQYLDSNLVLGDLVKTN